MANRLSSVILTGVSGMTLKYALVDDGYDLLATEQTAGVAELGGGAYGHTHDFSDGFRGYVIYYTGTHAGTIGQPWSPGAAVVVSALALNPQEVEYADVKTSTRATPAEVNAQVVDALVIDTYPQLAGPPGAEASLVELVTWLGMLARNRMTQTLAGMQSLYDDAGTVVVATASVSDDGSTFTRAEWVAA